MKAPSENQRLLKIEILIPYLDIRSRRIKTVEDGKVVGDGRTVGVVLDVPLERAELGHAARPTALARS